MLVDYLVATSCYDKFVVDTHLLFRRLLGPLERWRK